MHEVYYCFSNAKSNSIINDIEETIAIQVENIFYGSHINLS
ncbi:hypothetical protein [Trichocoleus sp. FACHB-591]|nr:hypothetical protein [Trichocoleus sp. FACHB-591]